MCWVLELVPRYGGAVASFQYTMWLQCFYTAVGGMLLRAADIKRKSSQFFNMLLTAYFMMTLYPFGVYLGLSSPTIIVGIAAAASVAIMPEKGHIFWHFFSSFGLFMWWFCLRVRPGNSPLEVNPDSKLITVIFYCVIKNAVRRLFMNITSWSEERQKRAFILLEHVVFTVWGWQVMVSIPGSDSWLRNLALCWDSEPFASEAFHMFYQAKLATHFEDVAYAVVAHWFQSSSSSSSPSSSSSSAVAAVSGAGSINPIDTLESQSDDKTDKSRDATKAKRGGAAASLDMKMLVHHLTTGALCGISYYFGYARIGSVVMFLHDASDVPLDMLRLCTSWGWEQGELVSFILTLVAWAWFRLCFFPLHVMWSIWKDSKSRWSTSSCVPGHCSNKEVWCDIEILIVNCHAFFSLFSGLV